MKNLLATILIGSISIAATDEANALVVNTSNPAVAAYDLSSYTDTMHWQFNMFFSSVDPLNSGESFRLDIRDTADNIIRTTSFTLNSPFPVSETGMGCCTTGFGSMPQIGSVLLTVLTGSFDITTLSMNVNTNEGFLSGVLLDLQSVPSSIPIPTALPLFGTGLAALGLMGWRRKRKSA